MPCAFNDGELFRSHIVSRPTKPMPNICKIILLARSKGRKAIRPPASGSKVPFQGVWGCSKRDVELSGSLLLCGV